MRRELHQHGSHHILLILMFHHISRIRQPLLPQLRPLARLHPLAQQFDSLRLPPMPGQLVMCDARQPDPQTAATRVKTPSRSSRSEKYLLYDIRHIGFAVIEQSRHEPPDS